MIIIDTTTIDTSKAAKELNRIFNNSPDSKEEKNKVRAFNNLLVSDADFAHIISECTSISLIQAKSKVSIIRKQGSAIVYQGLNEDCCIVRDCLINRNIKAEVI